MNWYFYLLVTVVLILILFLIFSAFLRRTADGLVKTLSTPHRQKQPETPHDYNLEYEDITIKTRDRINLKGWYIKSKGEKLAIFSHPGSFTKWGWNINDLGTGRNDTSYGKSVKFLPMIKNLVNAGYDVIMYDQRDHGESDTSPNNMHDVIKDAHLDVVAAIEYSMAQESLKKLPKALVLYCQSSFSGMVAMSKYPEVFQNSNIKAYVANQPTDLVDFYSAFGVPNIVLNAIKKAYIRGGLTKMEDNNPINWIKAIKLPTLVIQNMKDPWTNVKHVKEVYEKIEAEKEGLFLDMEPHRFAAYDYFNDKPDRLVDFLDKYTIS